MASSAVGHQHHVRFYEDTNVLAEQVGSYLDEALRAGDSGCAIARPLTLAVIELHLAKAGHDIAALRAQGRLELVDAADIAAAMVDDDGVRRVFHRDVEPVVRRLIVASGTGNVRAYGEIVDVLWARGQRDSVLLLEQLWHELIDDLPVTLLCGYQLRNFDGDAAAFDAVCQRHNAVALAQPATDASATMSLVLAQLEQRARSLELEVSRRKQLEERMVALLDLTGRLAAAADIATIAQLVTRAGVQAVSAVDCAMWLVDKSGTHLELLDATPGSNRAIDQYRSVPLSGNTPLALAIRSGDPLFLGTLHEYAQRFPESHARLDPVRTPQQKAFAVVPLVLDDRPLGGIVFAFDREREFTTSDRAFKAILARQCTLALSRVQLQQQEREARGEIELLYELTATAHQHDDPAAIYDAALATVRHGASCDRAAILLFDADGVMRFKAAHGLSETYQRAVEGHSPWARDALAPSPIAVDNTETDPAWAPYRDVFRAEGIRALAFVPLLYHRRLIGKFMLYRDRPRVFTQHELQFASTVGVHVAQAVERKRAEVELSRAYREEREAHILADEATRAREEILSVVSHDLRNPLGTILMGATTLLQLDSGERSHRVRLVAERVHRQAERMTRLIEDLVDFAGIQAGQLAIVRKPHKPDTILAATTDIFSSMAQERGLRFEASVRPDLPTIECDSERAVQVLSNLVANALKVTPKGGAISIGAEPKQDEIVFYVRDTGPGIDPEELPRLFERYWRGKESQYKGAGLGLSIARGIVDAHGGRIWAESRLGAGTTFYFSLASHRNN
jgi:signal transduction histidine kinase